METPTDHKVSPWGNTQVRFRTSHFSPEEVEKALSEVKPEFEAPKDFFVGIGRENADEVIGGVPEMPCKSNQPTFFAARGVNALKTLLTRINESLKKRFDFLGFKLVN